MEEVKIYGFEMSRISEVYLSTLSSIMTPLGIERYFFPLIYLNENSGKITQTDLAEAIRRDKVHTMRIVDYFCDRDLIVRKQNANDRRCQILEITDKGKTLVPLIKKGIAQTDELLFHNFSQEEKDNFKVSMDKLFETIKLLPEPKFIVKAFKRK
ncbi:MarR family winged helix-turn-helix transcriptional regulator [Flexithrix dorotheae]|uniref:MarR family winged helix-turn-helix transcriptional regulator n=1 Tax=Flexithrix dorotheae TaxID=70993 RepID=UPI000382655C|nr:MarR family transcriptional regulator [Flexithrix dorotheae]